MNPFEKPIAGDGISGAARAGTAERIGTFQRTQDRLNAEKFFNPKTATKTPAELRHEQWAAEYKAEADAKEAERKIEKLAADNIDLQNGSLRILEDGTRIRRVLNSTRWEFDQDL
jgi:hypothetical protein